MPLSLEQQKTVASHLNTRGQSPKCPVCGASNMSVKAEVTLAPVHGRPDDVFPMINVQCNFCAHLLQFAAEALFTAEALDLDSE